MRSTRSILIYTFNILLWLFSLARSPPSAHFYRCLLSIDFCTNRYILASISRANVHRRQRQSKGNGTRWRADIEKWHEERKVVWYAVTHTPCVCVCVRMLSWSHGKNCWIFSYFVRCCGDILFIFIGFSCCFLQLSELFYTHTHAGRVWLYVQYTSVPMVNQYTQNIYIILFWLKFTEGTFVYWGGKMISAPRSVSQAGEAEWQLAQPSCRKECADTRSGSRKKAQTRLHTRQPQHPRVRYRNYV